MKRLKGFIRVLRCWLGLHNVPKNWAYEEFAAIWTGGGVCPCCGRWKQGKALMDLGRDGKTTHTKYGTQIVYQSTNIPLVKQLGYVFKGTAFIGDLQPKK